MGRQSARVNIYLYGSIRGSRNGNFADASRGFNHILYVAIRQVQKVLAASAVQRRLES